MSGQGGGAPAMQSMLGAARQGGANFQQSDVSKMGGLFGVSAGAMQRMGPGHDRSPAGMQARYVRQQAQLAANPALATAGPAPWAGNVGPNQYLDANGQLQYGYGIGDPRNMGAPLYDDPRNNIKGTLGPKPGFTY